MSYFSVTRESFPKGIKEISFFPTSYPVKDFQATRILNNSGQIYRYSNSSGDWINYFYYKNKRVKEVHSCGYIKIIDKDVQDLELIGYKDILKEDTFMNRAELISICEAAVVPCTNWEDRDSAIAQNNVAEIYSRLNAGIPFTFNIEDHSTIWIDFTKPTEKEVEKLSYFNLDIDSVEDYREKVDPDYEDEIFTPNWALSSDSFSGYLPTRERLNPDGDWY